jgi:hypothetical protein
LYLKWRRIRTVSTVLLGARARAGVHFFSPAHEYNLLSSNHTIHTIPYSTRPALSRAALEPLDLSLLLLVRGRVELQRGGPRRREAPRAVGGEVGVGHDAQVEAAHSAERDVGLARSEEFLCATWKAGWVTSGRRASGRRARSSRGRMRAPFSKMCISSLSVAPDTRWTVHAYLRGARHGLRLAGGCVRLEDGQVTHAGSSGNCVRT